MILMTQLMNIKKVNIYHHLYDLLRESRITVAQTNLKIDIQSIRKYFGFAEYITEEQF